MPSRLYLLGFGVDPEAHATLETLQALAGCDAVFHHGFTPAQAKGLKRFSPEASWTRLQDAGADKPVLAALARGKTVALATPGHPFYWSALAGRLAAACAAKKVEWRTFGAVSPMGTAIAVAGVTLGTNVFGLQAFDAAALAAGGATVNPEWPLVLYFYSPLGKDGLKKAAAALKGLYPDDHAVLWCDPSREGRTAPLGRLASKAADIGVSTVLYLAPSAVPASTIGRLDQNQVRGIRKVAAWVRD